MSNRTKIGLREIRALAPDQDVWDTTVVGFGARRQRTEAVAYVVMYRNADGRQRRFTIGRHGSPWTPDTARTEARRILGAVAGGDDPSVEKRQAKKAATVADLCDVYMDDAQAGRLLTKRRIAKKPSTISTDRSRIERHVKPFLGRLAVAAVTREDIERFMHAVAAGETIPKGSTKGPPRRAEGRGAASRTVGLLGAIFAYACRKHMREDNPVRGVMRFADGRRERRLSDLEYRKLGDGFRAVSSKAWPPALSAARFLALTGWRSGEVIGLQWSEVDLARRTASLPDTKTGRSMRPLSSAACAVLAEISMHGHFVFPASRGEGKMSSFSDRFATMIKAAALTDDISAHVLRHSFASLASDIGLSEPTIAALIGHRGASMTSRYIHSADAVLLAAADMVAGRIVEMLDG